MKPAFLFIVVLTTISVVELLIMFSLRFLPDLNPVSEALLDAFLLSLFSVPFLYYLMFIPHRKTVRDRIHAELEYEKMAEISHMKSEFISVAAHELRTPLTSIIGYSDLMLETREFNEEFANIINQKANVIERLIDDLLDLSLGERGRPLQIQQEISDIVPFIESVIECNKEKYPSRHFDVCLPKTKVNVRFDKIRIEQVIDNLLSNANKFSSGEFPVEISATLQDECFKVQVRDWGIGMSPEESGQVFDKFYRASFSNTSPAGLGLGMTIVKEIIVLHGGEVQVESMPGAGTTVSFSLPVG